MDFYKDCLSNFESTAQTAEAFELWTHSAPASLGTSFFLESRTRQLLSKFNFTFFI